MLTAHGFVCRSRTGIIHIQRSFARRLPQSRGGDQWTQRVFRGIGAKDSLGLRKFPFIKQRTCLQKLCVTCARGVGMARHNFGKSLGFCGLGIHLVRGKSVGVHCRQHILAGGLLRHLRVKPLGINNQHRANGDEDCQNHLPSVFHQPFPKVDEPIRMCFCGFHGRRMLVIYALNASRKWRLRWTPRQTVPNSCLWTGNYNNTCRY